jgi:hypothetical protein
MDDEADKLRRMCDRKKGITPENIKYQQTHPTTIMQARFIHQEDASPGKWSQRRTNKQSV